MAFNYKTKINRTQSVLTKEQYEKLCENGRNRDQDHAPVVKFFDPMGAGTWLLSELEIDEDGLPNGIAFGLCDLGMGYPELGYVDLHELIDIQNHRRYQMGLERDLDFTGKHPMSVYADAARNKSRIVENPTV